MIAVYLCKLEKGRSQWINDKRAIAMSKESGQRLPMSLYLTQNASENHCTRVGMQYQLPLPD